MGRSPDHLTVAQHDLLKWVADGCADGVYDGTSHRVSARGLHNRGLIQVVGRSKTWTAKITPQGTRVLQEQTKRVEAERQRERKEAQARAEQERERQLLQARAIEVLDAVVAAGGRLELGADINVHGIEQIEGLLAREGLLPVGQRLTHEPTRMDPTLGVTAYLEPDFTTLTPLRDFKVTRQLRDPHPAVVTFQDKRAYVSKKQISRTARLLQAIVSAATEMGWKVSRPHNAYRGHSEVSPDLALSLPSSEVAVTVRELDQRGRTGFAFTTGTEYYTRVQTTTANKGFLASGRLELTLTKQWDRQSILSLRDTGETTLEEQIPTFIQRLEISEAQAHWAREEEARRTEIREVRWQEVRKEAFTALTQQRNAEKLRDELARRDSVAAMREYADEIDAVTARSTGFDAEAAHEWANWIRQHAEATDPLNGPLRIMQVTSCSHEDLEPHMKGWSTYGPRRR
ncbi:hypothetical protein FCG67_03825 [Rhodococcus oryzae]|uniref:PE-PGRS family protein n=1 Tax=Rhodococcus oryzae TaxID=2571143 RepID=A0ABY2RS10_9NOCA|nr:hypothetical protein FCG67_03825 [Rhodococcus oryzae]